MIDVFYSSGAPDGEYYSLQWRPREGAQSDESFKP